MPSPGAFGHNGHPDQSLQLVVTQAPNSAQHKSNGSELIGLKIELGPSIQLGGTDKEYGRKQILTIPAHCSTVSDVKYHLQLRMDLPRINLKLDGFSLRDDADVAVFSCFKESVVVVDAVADGNLVPTSIHRREEDSEESSETPGRGSLSLPYAAASQIPHLTKSAKRRFRKLRLQERKAQQNDQEPEKMMTESPRRGNQITEATEKAQDSTLNKTQSPKFNSSGQFYESTPLQSTSAISANSSNATFSGNSGGEFLAPKPKKAKFVRTPLLLGTEDEMASISTVSSGTKSSPSTPFTPKAVKNPQFSVSGFLDKLNSSSSSNEGSFLKKPKPDTPNLPMVSKSPHYNYVNKSTLTQLSRNMISNLKLAQDSEELRRSESRKIREKLQDANKSLQNEAHDADESDDKQDNKMEITDEPGKDAYFDGLETVKSMGQISEGNIIAFKIAQLNEDNCPVVSPYKEARVKSRNGSYVQVEYRKTDSTEPTLLEVEGYDTYSTNNPEMVDFNWMISPKLVSSTPNRGT